MARRSIITGAELLEERLAARRRSSRSSALTEYRPLRYTGKRKHMSTSSSRSFALDKSDAKLMGVCSGFANMVGWNPLWVRLGLVAATLFVLGPVAVLAYLIIGWAAS